MLFPNVTILNGIRIDSEKNAAKISLKDVMVNNWLKLLVN